jgi:hypothetical protein
MNIYDNIGCNPTVKDVELEVPLPHHHNRLQTLPNDYKSCNILPVLENGKKISPQPSHRTHNYSPSNKVEMMGKQNLKILRIHERFLSLHFHPSPMLTTTSTMTLRPPLLRKFKQSTLRSFRNHMPQTPNITQL